MFNPAAAGLEDQINLALLARKEWTSFPGAPQTNLLVGDMPFQHNSMGLGLRVCQESIVANDNWYAHLLYSYKINLEKGKLAFGVNVGVAQYNFASSRLTIKDVDDQLLVPVTNGRIHPDFGFGLLYSKKKFLAGISVLNMLKHPNNVFNPEVNQGYIKPNYVSFMSYKWKLTANWDLEGIALGNYWNGSHMIGSTSVIGHYKKGFLLGGNFRTNKSLGAMLAVGLDRVSVALENCTLGYSYDINFSSSNNYLNNTHEITLAIKFDKPKNIRKEKQKPEEISPYDL